ncbi:hypothetical protein JTE90_001914 [Oedothorax gibbosus]|uniref:Uncharacterized protein n=1 Tax=Oedothorax gibbosus TaxID=931172 RepID=A0AAV6VWE1_9ARAC|nr:hypothetical protein JTE90_001914 [Oedothorax gibbosus]
MKKTTAFFLIINIIAINGIVTFNGYYDCSKDDCAFFDFPNDPRNPYLNLYLQVESGLNSTVGIPDWKVVLEFFDGYLSININEFFDECACPVVLKEDKAFVTFHARDMLDVWYSYKFPFSKDKDGAIRITCVYTFSTLLMDQKNHVPSFQNVEVTSLHIFNLDPYGIPLEWLDNLSGKYKKIIEKALYVPVKKLLEDTLLQAFNGELKTLNRRSTQTLNSTFNAVMISL